MFFCSYLKKNEKLADMYAQIISSMMINLTHIMMDDLMVTNTAEIEWFHFGKASPHWEYEPGKFISIHFCQNYVIGQKTNHKYTATFNKHSW